MGVFKLLKRRHKAQPSLRQHGEEKNETHPKGGKHDPYDTDATLAVALVRRFFLVILILCHEGDVCFFEW